MVQIYFLLARKPIIQADISLTIDQQKPIYLIFRL